MADVSLSGIEFKIIGSSDGASDSVKKLTKDLEELKKTLSSTAGVSGFVKSLKKLENLNTTMISVTYSILKDMSQIDFSNLAQAAQGIKDIAKAARDIANIGSRTSNVVERVAPKNAFQTLGVAVGNTTKTLWKFSSAVAKIGMRGISRMISMPFKKATENVSGFAKSISNTLGGFKRIVFYRAIRSAIKEISQAFKDGIKNLYGWSVLVDGKFKDSMDSLSTSALYFKNSLGAMIAPIINAVAPAIDFLVDKIVGLLNVINQLLAKLTGASSWTRAKKKATEYGDAVGGAGAAAKEAMRYLAPFDELNVLPDQKDRSKGGGSSDDYSGMFEDVAEFNQGIADFAESIKEAARKADWKGLGELLGGKVNEIIDSINFASIGGKVGQGINALFSTKYWTLEEINFRNIGKKISEFITGDANGNGGIFNQVDWEIVGRGLSQKWTILGDLIVGAIENLDWGQIASAAGQVIQGFFSQITDWLSGVDWHEFGNTLCDKIIDAVDAVDWSGVAGALFGAIGAVLGAAGSVLSEIAKRVWDDLKKYFLGYIKDYNGNGEMDGGEILSGLLHGIVDAMKNIGAWVKENIWTPFVNGIKSVFGIHSPATTMEPFGNDIGEGLKNGIKSAFTNLKNWVQTNILDKIQSAIDKGKEVVVTIKSKISEWKDSLNTWLNGLKSDSDASFNVTAVVNNLVDAIPVAKKKIADMVANIKDKIDNIPVVKKIIDNMKSKFTTTQDSIPQANKVINGMKSVFNTFKDSIPPASKVISGVKATLTSWENRLSGVWTNTKATLNTWENRLSGVWSNAKATFNTWVSNIGTPSINSRANITSYSDGIYGTPSINSSAYFTSYSDGIYRTPDVNSNANFTDYTTYDLGYPSIDVQANVTDLVTAGYNREIWKARGGVLNHGVWSNIPQYARGTSKAHGSMFVAGEAGPEVVGHIGGRTEVLNRSQLASTMYSSVVSAMSRTLNSLAFSVAAPSLAGYGNAGESAANEETLYTAFLRALNDSNSEEIIELDGDVVYKKMVQRNRQNTRRTGVNAMMAT